MPIDESHLVEQYRSRILYFALRRLRNRTAAEEVTHETLLAVIEAVRNNQLRHEEKVGSFIFGVANNQYLKHLREQSRTEQLPEEDADDPKTVWMEDPEAELLLKEQRWRVRTGWSRLRPEERRILSLCFGERGSMEKVAEELGMAYDTLRKRKSRALERLRKMITSVTEPPQGGTH